MCCLSFDIKSFRVREKKFVIDKKTKIAKFQEYPRVLNMKLKIHLKFSTIKKRQTGDAGAEFSKSSTSFRNMIRFKRF